MAAGTAETAPRIERVGAHIANLERRLEWLKERIALPDRNERVRSFDVSEAKALEAAIRLMQFYRVALEPETDPVLALAELLDVTEIAAPMIPTPHMNESTRERLEEALRRARRVLRELSPD